MRKLASGISVSASRVVAVRITRVFLSGVQFRQAQSGPQGCPRGVPAPGPVGRALPRPSQSRPAQSLPARSGPPRPLSVAASRLQLSMALYFSTCPRHAACRCRHVSVSACTRLWEQLSAVGVALSPRWLSEAAGDVALFEPTAPTLPVARRGFCTFVSGVPAGTGAAAWHSGAAGVLSFTQSGVGATSLSILVVAGGAGQGHVLV